MTKKTLSLICLLSLLLLFFPVRYEALEEIEDNSLNFKVDRMETAEKKEKEQSDRATSHLFVGQTIERLALAKKYQVEQVKATKNSLFETKSIKVEAHDPKELFKSEAEYSLSLAKREEREAAKQENKYLNLPSLIAGGSVLVVGLTGVYFYMKKR